MGAPKIRGSCPFGTTTDFEAEIENPCPAAGQCCIPNCNTFVLPFFLFFFYLSIFSPSPPPPPPKLSPAGKKRKLKENIEEIQDLHAKILLEIHVAQIQIHNQAFPHREPSFLTTKTITMIMRISIYQHHHRNHYYSKNKNYNSCNPFFLRTILLLLRPSFFLRRRYQL